MKVKSKETAGIEEEFDFSSLTRDLSSEANMIQSKL